MDSKLVVDKIDILVSDIPIFVWVKFIQQVMGRIAYHFFLQHARE